MYLVKHLLKMLLRPWSPKLDHGQAVSKRYKFTVAYLKYKKIIRNFNFDYTNDLTIFIENDT